MLHKKNENAMSQKLNVVTVMQGYNYINSTWGSILQKHV